MKIPIEEYLKVKVKTREREMWDEIGYKYDLKDTSKRGLGELFKDITDFEIPLPSVDHARPADEAAQTDQAIPTTDNKRTRNG